MAKTYHRWYLLPVIGLDDANHHAPKYMDDDRLDGYASGGPFSREDVADAGYEHLLAHNDAERWAVVVAWGVGTDAWNALNEIHAHNHDTETLADYGDDVEPVMNDRFDEEGWNVYASALDESENTA